VGDLAERKNLDIPILPLETGLSVEHKRAAKGAKTGLKGGKALTRIEDLVGGAACSDERTVGGVF